MSAVPLGGMIESIAPAREGIQNICPQFRQRILGYLDRVFARDGDFPFYENPGSSNGSNLETAPCALMCLQHVHCPEWIEELRPRLLPAIDRYYDPQTRTYRDTEDRYTTEVTGAWRLHNDAVARRAIGILGTQARPEPDSMQYLAFFPWAQPFQNDPEGWIERLFEQNARSAAKETFQYMTLYCKLNRIRCYAQFDDHLRRIIQCLESKRDSTTGFIGHAPGGAMGWAMRGFRNMSREFYWPMGVPQPMRELVMDSTLACQNADGSFDDRGMCANMDAVELLAEYALQTGHRCQEVIDAVRRCVGFIFSRLSLSCGGFRFELSECPDPERQGYGSAKVTVGTAFVLYTIRFWQAIDSSARDDLAAAWPAVVCHDHM